MWRTLGTPDLIVVLRQSASIAESFFFLADFSMGSSARRCEHPPAPAYLWRSYTAGREELRACVPLSERGARELPFTMSFFWLAQQQVLEVLLILAICSTRLLPQPLSVDISLYVRIFR